MKFYKLLLTGILSLIASSIGANADTCIKSEQVTREVLRDYQVSKVQKLLDSFYANLGKSDKKELLKSFGNYRQSLLKHTQEGISEIEAQNIWQECIERQYKVIDKVLKKIAFKHPLANEIKNKKLIIDILPADSIAQEKNQHSPVIAVAYFPNFSELADGLITSVQVSRELSVSAERKYFFMSSVAFVSVIHNGFENVDGSEVPQFTTKSLPLSSYDVSNYGVDKLGSNETYSDLKSSLVCK